MDAAEGKPTRGRRKPAIFAAIAVVLVAATGAVLTVNNNDPYKVDPANPDFGANVTIADPSMSTAAIQELVDELANAQRDNEMGQQRHAVLFEPGTYGADGTPLHIEVGYYTEVAGLGAMPGDVAITGSIEAFNRCVGTGEEPHCIALNNFWRSVSNIELAVTGVGQDICRGEANFWAVSQAASMRRMDIHGGTLSLMDWCTEGPHYASGGFIADSRLPDVTNGSQQQWLTRNSTLEAWSNAVWNQVFAGVHGAPTDAAFPKPPYTTLDKTPLSREKPYLHVDEHGHYGVRVPDAVRDSRGVSWDAGETPGRTVSIADFFIATTEDSAADMAKALRDGRHLLLTPGVYDVDTTLVVTEPDTVVLGLGHATLTAVDGAVPMRIDDVPGVVVAGVTIDAGLDLSPVLLQVGAPAGEKVDVDVAADPENPITLSDVYFRVGGPHVGKATTALEVNADGVLIDHTWVWRADHGIEGFTEGVNGDTDRWNTNIGISGVVINGDDVTATGLFVEHFQEHNTVWNGERGTVILYQSELAYDAPSQADWTQPDGTLGWPGYLVSDHVEQHMLHAGGVYVFNQNDPSIVTESGFVMPDGPGVHVRHAMAVNLGGGTINHVVNGAGAAVPPSSSGSPEYLTYYPE